MRAYRIAAFSLALLAALSGCEVSYHWQGAAAEAACSPPCTRVQKCERGVCVDRAQAATCKPDAGQRHS